MHQKPLNMIGLAQLDAFVPRGFEVDCVGNGAVGAYHSVEIVIDEAESVRIDGSYHIYTALAQARGRHPQPRPAGDALEYDAVLLLAPVGSDFFIMFNSNLDTQTFVVAEPPSKKYWYRVVDTGLVPPNDILPQGSEEAIQSQRKYSVKARSMVILISKERPSNG